MTPVDLFRKSKQRGELIPRMALQGKVGGVKTRKKVKDVYALWSKKKTAKDRHAQT